MKTNVTMSIEGSILNKFKKIVPNVSQATENWMKTKLDLLVGEEKYLDIEKISQKLSETQKELDENITMLKELKEKKELIENEIKEKEEKYIEKEIQKEKNQKKCVICKSILNGEPYDKAWVSQAGQQLYTHRKCLLDWYKENGVKPMEELRDFILNRDEELQK